jgi:hypothetical protein
MNNELPDPQPGCFGGFLNKILPSKPTLPPLKQRSEVASLKISNPENLKQVRMTFSLWYTGVYNFFGSPMFTMGVAIFRKLTSPNGGCLVKACHPTHHRRTVPINQKS